MLNFILHLFRKRANPLYRPASIEAGLWASLALGDGRRVDWSEVM